MPKLREGTIRAQKGERAVLELSVQCEPGDTIWEVSLWTAQLANKLGVTVLIDFNEVNLVCRAGLMASDIVEQYNAGGYIPWMRAGAKKLPISET